MTPTKSNECPDFVILYFEAEVAFAEFETN